MTPVLKRQNSSELLSANFVLASATFSRTWYFADSNMLGGSFCLQPQKSYVQMTEALQASSACNANGTSAV